MGQSLREIAEWMDPDRPAERLYGNGPPFESSRPQLYDVDKLEFGWEKPDVDYPSPDLPESRVVKGPVDLKTIEKKVTYKGVIYLDLVDLISDTDSSGRTHLSGEEPETPQDVYEYNLFFADQNAYDLGMVNRTPGNVESGSLPEGFTDKGIIENHRWVDPAESSDASQKWRSIRNVVDRHRKGVRHRVVYQNLGLQPQRHHSRDDAKEFGRQFGSNGFDIVAVCELYGKGRLKRMKQGYENSYSRVESRYAKPEYSVLVGHQNEAPISRRITNFETGKFENPGPLLRSTQKEGWVRVVIEVPSLPNSPEFEVYVTHLQPVADFLVEPPQHDKKQQAKIQQMRELADIIRKRNENDQVRSRPKILMGDFNIGSNKRPGPMDSDSGMEKGEYFKNLLHQMHSVGMQDVWLTHGGPGHCSNDPDGYLCDPFEPRTPGHYQGGRIDYVFLEKPRPYHEVQIDVSRTKLVKWPKSGSDFPPDAAHKGIAFDILTSPPD